MQENEKAIVGAVGTGLRIGGKAQDTGRTFPVEDPSTGETIAHVADAGPEEGHAALDAAVAAADDWAATPPRERSEILRRAFELLIERRDELAVLMTLEMGKSVTESTAEVTYAAEFFRWFSEEAVRISGDFATDPSGKRMIVMRRPVGPCLLITPWNMPLSMGTRKIGPAIAAGCTMVVKPADLTPLTMLYLADVLAEAGLPAGVLNVVPTTDPGGVVEPLLRDPRLRKLSFTGSTAVGRKLLAQAADTVLRTSMELGGNAPFVVCADADVDKAVDGAMLAKMRIIGEACVAANRFYVHADVAEEFTAKMTERMAAQTVGRGTEPGVDVGPLVSGVQRDKVDGLVSEAVADGATVRLGGEVPDGPGWYYPPTVLADVPPTTRLAHEEIFGPVAPIFTFTDEDEAIRLANDTEYGLVAFLYTQDLRRAFELSERLDAGMVGLNQGMVSNPAAPFGGVKQSGLGREGGRVGIDEYLETKYVAVTL